MVDWDFFRVAADESEEIMEELITLFTGSYGKRLADLEAACVAGEGKRVHHAAHALKGGVAVFGAAKAVEACEVLEIAGSEGKTADCAARAAELRLLIEQLATELRTFKKSS